MIRYDMIMLNFLVVLILGSQLFAASVADLTPSLALEIDPRKELIALVLLQYY